MSSQIIRNEVSFERSSRAMPTSALKNGKLKVFIPYDGSESAETALDNLKRAGLPPQLEALEIQLERENDQRSSNEAVDFWNVFLRSGTKRSRRAAGAFTRG